MTRIEICDALNTTRKSVSAVMIDQNEEAIACFCGD